MTVKELIEKLQTLDPNKEVLVECFEGDCTTPSFVGNREDELQLDYPNLVYPKEWSEQIKDDIYLGKVIISEG